MVWRHLRWSVPSTIQTSTRKLSILMKRSYFRLAQPPISTSASRRPDRQRLSKTAEANRPVTPKSIAPIVFDRFQQPAIPDRPSMHKLMRTSCAGTLSPTGMWSLFAKLNVSNSFTLCDYLFAFSPFTRTQRLKRSWGVGKFLNCSRIPPKYGSVPGIPEAPFGEKEPI